MSRSVSYRAPHAAPRYSCTRSLSLSYSYLSLLSHAHVTRRQHTHTRTRTHTHTCPRASLLPMPHVVVCLAPAARRMRLWIFGRAHAPRGGTRRVVERCHEVFDARAAPLPRRRRESRAARARMSMGRVRVRCAAPRVVAFRCGGARSSGEQLVVGDAG